METTFAGSARWKWPSRPGYESADGRDGNERQGVAVRPCYFFTVNGTEYCVVSHIILSSPPPPLAGSMAIVNWSTGLSSVFFLRSTLASSLAFSAVSL